jgi:hypothetical protein
MSGMDDELQYDVMVENALRGVVRQALEQVAQHGLPGEHHFYITFRTDHPDVQLSDRLREQYPREMTIVLQFQFWDLSVGETAFQVTLSFNNRSEFVEVPFDAVIAFADPSVRFGLQFDATDGSGGATESGGSGGEAAAGESGGSGSGSGASGGESDGDNVVTLDRFRKS